MTEYKLGQTVETSDGRNGTIRYIGSISAAQGQFIGLELSEPNGKNDGSVRGERYFTCKPEHGLFIRPNSIIQIISQPAPAPAPAKPKPQPPRPSLRPTGLGGLAKPPPRASAAPTRTSIIPSSQKAVSQAPARKLSISTAKPVPATKPPSRTSKFGPNPPSSSSTSTTTSKPVRDPSAKTLNPVVDTLETKNRHLEKQLADLKERLKELDNVRGERDRFEGLIQKLQSKCQAYHQEIGDLKGNIKRAEAEMERLSRNEQEHESVLELATLDREMAEERAEQAEAELEQIRQRLEEKELELSIIIEESTLLTEDMSDEAKQAAGFNRLQTENDRLREALIRLKEMTEETEIEMKQRVRELEAEVEGTGNLREERDSLEAEVAKYEATIHDLSEQLDAANSWEEVIEDLSGQNQQIRDQLVEKDIVIEDLENLKELNDELELHHIEQAHELRAELEAKDIELAEQMQRIEQQTVTIADQDVLIAKFRDLVVDLQSRMTDAESSKLMSEEQAKDVTSRFTEVMELNRNLRKTKVNTTAAFMTAELQKNDAEHAQEELEIIKQFMPKNSDFLTEESLQAYFRAKRIAFKSGLLASLMKEMDLPSEANPEANKLVNEFLPLDTIYQLQQLEFRSTQFSRAVATSSPSQFKTFGYAYADFNDISQKLDHCMNILVGDDTNYADMSHTLEQSIRIFDIVTGEFKDVLAAHPEDELVFRISSIKSTLGFFKATFNTTYHDSEIVDSEQQSADKALSVASKLLRTLETLRQDSLYPQLPDGVDAIVELDEVLKGKLYRLQKSAAVEVQDPEAFNLADIASTLASWNEHASVLMNNVEIERTPAPWVLQAIQMEAAKKQDAEAENKLQVLTAEHRSTMLQVRERDEIIETKELEIEHLTAKAREMLKKTEDYNRLKEDFPKKEQEIEEMRVRLRAESAELMRLKANIYFSDHAKEQTSGTITPVEKVTNAPPPTTLPTTTAFAMIVQALQDENHWLRRRENAEMLGRNLKAMVDEIRKLQNAEIKREFKHKQAKADEMLAMALNEAELASAPSKASSNRVKPGELPDLSDWGSPDWKPATPSFIQSSSNQNRWGVSPLVLVPPRLPLSWAPEASAPSSYLENLEDLSFVDLSPTAEEFTIELETEDDNPEDFSELGNATLDGIMERVHV